MLLQSVARALLVACVAGCSAAHAHAPYRVATAYEDTVRVVILYNTPVGACAQLPAVGEQTRDFSTT